MLAQSWTPQAKSASQNLVAVAVSAGTEGTAIAHHMDCVAHTHCGKKCLCRAFAGLLFGFLVPWNALPVVCVIECFVFLCVRVCVRVSGSRDKMSMACLLVAFSLTLVSQKSVGGTHRRTS